MWFPGCSQRCFIGEPQFGALQYLRARWYTAKRHTIYFLAGYPVQRDGAGLAPDRWIARSWSGCGRFLLFLANASLVLLIACAPD
jgi:hypothetical protein